MSIDAAQTTEVSTSGQSGLKGTSEMFSSLGTHTVVETPEEKLAKARGEQVATAIKQYSSMSDKDKARLSPTMKTAFDAGFGTSKSTNETSGAIPTASPTFPATEAVTDIDAQASTEEIVAPGMLEPEIPGQAKTPAPTEAGKKLTADELVKQMRAKRLGRLGGAPVTAEEHLANIRPVTEAALASQGKKIQ